jgi:hypothetical protein
MENSSGGEYCRKFSTTGLFERHQLPVSDECAGAVLDEH